MANLKPSAPDIDILPLSLQIHPPLVPEVFPDAPARSSEESKNLISSSSTHFRDDPFSFLREISLHYSGTGWRAYDDPIGQRVFYKGFSEEMKARVLSAGMLRGKLKELAERRVAVEESTGLFGAGSKGEKRKAVRRREIERQLESVADGIVDGMICKMENKRFIRGAYFFSVQLLARTYHQGVHVSALEVQNLRRIATLAAKKKQSLIFLPCHRSHVDYISLQVICYRLGLTLPAVVSGDNLNFPLVGPFLQHAGAMYIRRSFAGDELYTSAVQGYVDSLLKGGWNFECFIEGTRSRTGKLLPPKFGILGFILESLLSGQVEDAYIIPVSTQYDKVIETEAYVNELLGIPKQKENLWDFLGSSKVLSLKMGRVDVRFHEPWSLREFINNHLEKAPAMASSSPPSSPTVATDATPPDVRLRLLRSLGYKVLSDINAVSVVMPTSLIGTILLTLRGRGVGKSELVRRIEWLSERIRAKGGRVAHFGNVGTDVVVERGLEVLGELVGTVDGLAEETFFAVDRFQLSFYRNMVIHLFISETIVAASMYTRVKQGGGPANQVVPYGILFDQVSFLSQLFRGEFVYPTLGINQNLHQTLQGLAKDAVITIGRSVTTGEIEYVELSDEERECGRENFDFYCFLIWPFIESSWLAGVAIIGLTPLAGHAKDEDENVWVAVKDAQDMAQLMGKTLYHQGDLSYFEAVNKENLKNAFKRFQEEGIISTRQSSPPLMKISDEWVPQRDENGNIKPSGRLWEFVECIAVSRREGKNRRDNASVSGRVLRLAGLCGEELFRRAREGPGGSKAKL